MPNYTIDTFLRSPTPICWVEMALANIPLLLVDHAHCEKKAAATALGMIYRYSDKPLLLNQMSKLAREELRHFEQVLAIIKQRGEAFCHLPPGPYAASLHQLATTHEPKKLIDSLILGAFIEARSCERFRLLADYLPVELGNFYRKLYLAEARHFETYLELAAYYSNECIDQRIVYFARQEAELISQKDSLFRFHSGVPVPVSNAMSSEPSLIKSPS